MRHHHTCKPTDCAHLGDECCGECCEPGGVIEADR